MNSWKPTKIEWITFLTMMPFIGFGVYYLLYGERAVEPELFVRAFPLIFSIGFLSWYLHVLIMHCLRIWFPSFRQTLTRLCILGISHLSLITCSMVLFFYGFNAWHFQGYHLNVHNFNLAVILGIAVTMIATSIWEGEYIFYEMAREPGGKRIAGASEPAE